MTKGSKTLEVHWFFQIKDRKDAVRQLRELADDIAQGNRDYYVTGVEPLHNLKKWVIRQDKRPKE